MRIEKTGICTNKCTDACFLIYMGHSPLVFLWNTLILGVTKSKDHGKDDIQ